MIFPASDVCGTDRKQLGQFPSVVSDEGEKYFAHGSHHGISNRLFSVLEV